MLAPFAQAASRDTRVGSYLSLAAEAASSERTYVDVLVRRARDHLAAEGEARDPATAALMLEEAIRGGSVVALVDLARLLAHGDGVEADPARARDLLELAIDRGAGAFAGTELGDLYRADTPLRNPQRAAEAYRAAINAGSEWAMFKLGQMLAVGDGVASDPPRASYWFEQAIATGGTVVAAAAAALGDLYIADTPMRNPLRAVAAYQKAADAGNEWAMLRLGEILAVGDGVPSDPGRARELFERAITVGGGVVSSAASALGDLYLADTPIRDPLRAAAAYQKAADAGNEWAMFALAQMLARGDGVPRDPNRARDLFEEAISAGGDVVDVAADALGDLYLADTSIRDPHRAAEAYQKAADAGNKWAMLALAQMLAGSEGVPREPNRARDLFEEAISAGGDVVNVAADALGDLYLADTPIRDPHRAAEAYKTAADAGNGSAMVKLARMLVAGEEVPRDVDLAVPLLRGALERGHTAEAALILGDLYLARGQPGAREKARAYYEQAAAVDSPYAHLALARLLSESQPTGENLRAIVMHLDAAVRHVGAAMVARQMLQFPEEILVGATQQLLVSAGYAVTVNGIHDRATAAAINDFCRAEMVKGCFDEFINSALVVALLQADGRYEDSRN